RTGPWWARGRSWYARQPRYEVGTTKISPAGQQLQSQQSQSEQSQSEQSHGQREQASQQPRFSWHHGGLCRPVTASVWSQQPGWQGQPTPPGAGRARGGGGGGRGGAGAGGGR